MKQFIQKFATARSLLAGLVGAAVPVFVHFFPTVDAAQAKDQALGVLDAVYSVVNALILMGLVGSAHNAEQPEKVAAAKAKASRVTPVSIVLLAALGISGCGSPVIAGLMSAADQAGRALAPVLGWCQDAGADRAMVERAVEAAKSKDYQTAVVLTDEMLRNLEAAGREVPEEYSQVVALAMGAMAAQGVQDGMRALSQ